MNTTCGCSDGASAGGTDLETGQQHTIFSRGFEVTS